MFERLLAFFEGPEDYKTPLPPADAQHVLGALLVRAAKVDEAYLFEEVAQIDALLIHLYDLDPLEAAKMRAACEKLEQAMPRTTELARILHDAIGAKEREDAVAALWKVVFADGVERPAEDALLARIEATLGVPPEVSKRLHDAAQKG